MVVIDYTFLFQQSIINFKPSSAPHDEVYRLSRLLALAQKLIEFSVIIEMAAETIDKFFARVSMALGTSLF